MRWLLYHLVQALSSLWLKHTHTLLSRSTFCGREISLQLRVVMNSLITNQAFRSACFESEEHNPSGSETSAGSFCSTECFLTGGFVRFRLLDASFFLPRTVAAPGDTSPTVQIEFSVVDKFTYYSHDSGW